MRGLVVLGPGDLGVDPSIHQTVFEKEKIAAKKGGFILSAGAIHTQSLLLISRPIQLWHIKSQSISERLLVLAVPEVVDVINSPGIIKACNELVGEGWAIVVRTPKH